MIESVLAHADSGMVREAPFPHLVLENALSSNLYDTLSEDYPPIELFSGGKPYRSNRVMFYKAGNILARGEVGELWREFVEYHTSTKFFVEVLRVFGGHIRKMYPKVDWPTIDTGVRGVDDGVDILMDAQFGINTPTVGKQTSVRGIHVDNATKLYNGLLYFRHPDDVARGGDFIIYQQLRGSWEKHSTVPYRANTLVFFVNCAQAAHAVSPRGVGPYPRRYVSYAGECQKILFRSKI